uniref:Integrase, catalytic region, zinc finger, CCHC-type, peptidase aspartic, catalytic n=1 Tax=Tanacetum cinerariifolium TaxID=118510 RepID=A0A6L2MRU3_TANCI|nr:integrase, catalytic region, zinc finger, CCHC-type, peptidase aspartic, catalytic [Tanacetum cinerariifolium]
MDNKSVNDTLTAELERYKEQVKVLKEGQNVEVKSRDNFLDSYKQNAEIDRLTHTLSEQLQEKGSLMKLVDVLKNDFTKEESKNIDREIALEKKIKHLDNIVYKRDQSAQTVHMLTKPMFFYDHSTKQALGYQNPFYLKKAQQLEPKLYDGNAIKNTCAIVIPDSKETLMLAEESHSKIIVKQQDPMVLEKKVNTTPVDYDALNRFSQDFEKRFVLQTELSTEQAFWSQNSMNSSDPNLFKRPTKGGVLKELPKVGMEQAVILKEVVEQGKSQNPLNNSLDHACKFSKRIQELLIIIRQTYRCINNLSDKLVVVTLMNKAKRVRFTKPVNTASSSNLVSNKHALSSKGVTSSTSASGSQPSGNTKKDKIQRPPSSTQKNKVAAHLRTVKSSLKNKNYTVEPKGTTILQHSKLNANSNLITAITEVLLGPQFDLETGTPKHVVTLVYSRKPRKSKTTDPVSKSKAVQIVLWYLDFGCSKHIIRDRSQLTNFVNKFLGTVKFRNDHVAKIMGYGNYQIGTFTILRVYYKEGLAYNLFSVRKFCDLNLEVAFRQHTYFIRNLKGVNLLTGSHENNLYTLSLGDMIASSPICHLSKASKTKSWSWHRRPFVFCKCNGKSKKKPHKPKSEDTNQEKLYLLHMDLCRLMRVASVNGKKYIIVIVDDYSQFTWDLLFQPLFDETLTPLPTVDVPIPGVIALIAEVVAPEPAASTGSPSSTAVDQDAPSPSNSQNTLETQSHVISNDVEEDKYDLDVAHINKDLFVGIEESPKTPTFCDDPLHESLPEDSTSQGSSSSIRQTYTLFKSLIRETKDHHIANVIVDPTLFTRKEGNDLLLVQIYFDDIIFASTNTAMCNEFANSMTTKFNSDSVDIPLVEKRKLNEDLQGKPVNATLYCGMIGPLMYLTSSRPDLTCAEIGMSLTAYADADHAGCQDTRCSTSGSAQFLGDKLVSWSSKKENCTAILICPKLPSQKFKDPPFEEEILSFIRELGHTGEIKVLYDVNVNHMHQPWRSFAAIINKCLSGKTTALESLCLSHAQILWGMYHNKNVNYVYLLWEDLVFQVENQNSKKNNDMYYP